MTYHGNSTERTPDQIAYDRTAKINEERDYSGIVFTMESPEIVLAMSRYHHKLITAAECCRILRLYGIDPSGPVYGA